MRAHPNACGSLQPGFGNSLRDIRSRLRWLWGTGKRIGSMVLKRNANGLIEVYGSGELRFRPLKFVRALGEEGGRAYAEALERVVPNIFNQRYPGLMPAKAAEVAPTLFEVIREAVEKSPSSISTHR